MPEVLVNEIFYSIQGEGSRSGLPCVFIRLQGCGLRCSWCDTPYALDASHGGTVWTINALKDHIAGYHCDFVMLTGGEPLEQAGSLPLITELCNAGYTVAIETGGHVDVGGVDSRATLIMDIKCPGSGMMKKNRFENLEYLKPSDEIKFVLQDRDDYEWARDIIRARKLRAVCKELLFSPVVESLEPKVLAGWMLEDHMSARLQLQLHALIWGRGVRGV